MARKLIGRKSEERTEEQERVTDAAISDPISFYNEVVPLHLATPSLRDSLYSTTDYTDDDSFMHQVGDFFGTYRVNTHRAKVKTFCKQLAEAQRMLQVHEDFDNTLTTHAHDVSQVESKRSGGSMLYYPAVTKINADKGRKAREAKGRARLVEFCRRLDVMQEEATATFPNGGLEEYEKASATARMDHLTREGQVPACSKSLFELFDKLAGDGPTAVTGATGSAKSFNLVLVLLFSHTHGMHSSRAW